MRARSRLVLCIVVAVMATGLAGGSAQASIAKGECSIGDIRNTQVQCKLTTARADAACNLYGVYLNTHRGCLLHVGATAVWCGQIIIDPFDRHRTITGCSTTVGEQPVLCAHDEDHTYDGTGVITWAGCTVGARTAACESSSYDTFLTQYGGTGCGVDTGAGVAASCGHEYFHSQDGPNYEVVGCFATAGDTMRTCTVRDERPLDATAPTIDCPLRD